MMRVITGLNEPRQAISYSATPGQPYVLNADLSVTIIDYANGQIVANIPEYADINYNKGSAMRNGLPFLCVKGWALR